MFGFLSTKKRKLAQRDHIRTFAYSYDVTTSLGQGTQTAFIKLYTDYIGWRELDIVCPAGDTSYVVSSILFQQCELWKNRKLTIKELDELCNACDVRNITQDTLTVSK